MELTSLDKLKEISKGQIIKLTGFDEEPFVARLKRPSFLNMVSNGTIPNELLNAAYIVFNGAKTSKDIISMKEANELYKLVAKSALVEPTLEQLEEIGLELTDEQLIEIFNFTQVGIKALRSFRDEQERTKSNTNK